VWATLTPLGTSNIIASDQDQKVTLVDSEPITSQNKIREKIHRNLSNISLLGWTMIASTIDLVSKIKKSNKNEYSQEDTCFTEGIRQIIDFLQATATNFIVLGSVAQAAWMEQSGHSIELSAYRANGSKRDIDIVCFEKDDQVKQLQYKVNQLTKANPYFPEVTLIQPIEKKEYKKLKDKRIGNKIKVMNTVITIENTNVFIQYGNLELPLNEDELNSYSVRYKGIPIKTVSPEILAGFALTRGGSIRFKDSDKIYNLLKATNTRIPTKFIDFARDIKIQYRKEYQQFLLYELLIFPMIYRLKKIGRTLIN